MKDNAKCFIKIKDGIFEEISYRELEKRRRKIKSYKDKKFIYIHGMLMEVTPKEYKEYYKEIERNRYAKKVLNKLQVVSIDELQGDINFNNKQVIEDKKANTELEVERKIEIEKLKKALLQLTEKEYELIKALFYEENSVRNYAKNIGIPFTTIQSQKKRILEKLKKLLKN